MGALDGYGFINEASGEMVAVSDCIVLNAACRRLLKAAIHCLLDKSRPFATDSQHFIDLDDAIVAAGGLLRNLKLV